MAEYADARPLAAIPPPRLEMNIGDFSPCQPSTNHQKIKAIYVHFSHTRKFVTFLGAIFPPFFGSFSQCIVTFTILVLSEKSKLIFDFSQLLILIHTIIAKLVEPTAQPKKIASDRGGRWIS